VAEQLVVGAFVHEDVRGRVQGDRAFARSPLARRRAVTWVMVPLMQNTAASKPSRAAIFCSKDSISSPLP